MREARDSNYKVNVMEPIDISMFGTEDDPCFGKLHDPNAKECSSCGDSELCCLVMGQLQHIKRNKLSEKIPFRDTEKVDINLSEVLDYIEQSMIDHNISKILLVKVLPKVDKKFNKASIYSKKDIKKYVIDAIKESSFVYLKKIKDKTYIKIKTN